MKFEQTQISTGKLWSTIKIIGAVLLFVYVLSRTDYEKLLALKDDFSWGWFLITALVFFAMLSVKTLQHYIFTGKKLPYSRILEIIIMQNVLMNFVATAAGIASYLTTLGLEKDVRLGRATTSFVLVKVGDIIAALSLFIVSLFFIGKVPDGANFIVVFVLSFAFVFFTFSFLLVTFRQRFVMVVRKVAIFLRLDRWDIIQKGLAYLNIIAEYSKQKFFINILKASLLSIVYVGLTMFWGYARFRAFSLPINFFVIVFVFSLLQFASWVPVFVLGGLGISEGLSIYLLGLFSLESIDVAATLIGIRIIIYLLNAFTLLYWPARSLINKLVGKAVLS